MLTLKPVETENRRIVMRAERGDDPEVWAMFAPLNRTLRQRARAIVWPQFAGRFPDGLKDVPSEDLAEISDAMSRQMIKLGILGGGEWGGIGYDEDKPVPVTPEHVDMLLAIDDIFDVADREYVQPEMMRQTEKNGYSRLRNGSSASAGAKATAGSCVPKGGARSARSKSTGATPRKPKKSGTSSAKTPAS